MMNSEFSTSPTVTVLIVTYNSKHVIDACLGPLSDGSLEIICIDNASTDGTPTHIRSRYPTVRVIDSGSNLGFAKAVNAGAKQASGSNYLLLNPDAIIELESVNALSSLLAADSSLGICAPLVSDPESEFATIGAGLKPSIWRMFLHSSGLSRLSGSLPFMTGHYLIPRNIGNNLTTVDWVSGGCLMIRSSAWVAADGLSERWFMYAEDIDLCLRVGRSGYGVVVDSNATAIHEVGGSSSNVDGRVSTVWITNLFDLYATTIARTSHGPLAWKAIVGVGFRGRAVAYRALAIARPRKKLQALRNAHRFSIYATALAAVRPDR
ncbi:glycosyltransferase family 2 protein [Glaciihabitans sp. dw_435]|uniref:glycosyltransferase family 2 protein n=1 Tax=Glaciihabitans sp. dw_435 TaxID=2720081 RepID=UPI001BD3682E|nr:glycosyltransferase family 2 protein [Glaciihabitans sp. dw_435]